MLGDASGEFVQGRLAACPTLTGVQVGIAFHPSTAELLFTLSWIGYRDFLTFKGGSNPVSHTCVHGSPP